MTDSWKIVASLATLQSQSANVPTQSVNSGSTPTFADVIVGGSRSISSDRVIIDNLNSKVDQNVKSGSTPTFADVVVGASRTVSSDRTALDAVVANVNQSLVTTSIPTFADIKVGSTRTVSSDRTALDLLSSRVNQAVNTTATPVFPDLTLAGISMLTDRRMRYFTSVAATTPTFWNNGVQVTSITLNSSQTATFQRTAAYSTGSPTYKVHDYCFVWRLNNSASTTIDRITFTMPSADLGTRIISPVTVVSQPMFTPYNKFAVIYQPAAAVSGTASVDLSFYESDTTPVAFTVPSMTQRLLTISFTMGDYS